MRYLAGTYAVITDLRLLNDGGGGASTPLLVRILLLAARTDGWLPVFLISNAAGRRGGGVPSLMPPFSRANAVQSCAASLWPS